ncbi:hypothetical protein [Caldilinea sp.]|uniref:hypothetical protein n=1 Tax=Caldilinea sp. TaxID=2293560 RepID=UPI002C443203|nr:hypothetical protein [Caldilinea sp.]HRA65206.1 hypothetical protein [Caldilinea sp.]
MTDALVADQLATDGLAGESNTLDRAAPSSPRQAGTYATHSRTPARSGELTVEHLLYGVIVLAAVGVRFVGLGAEPLSPAESATSWGAWLAANQVTVAGAPAPTSALFYGLQALTFWLFGSGDVLARMLPALAGVATVLLPWFWRAWLGRHAALALAALFAIDPWLTAWSRRADPFALTTFLALLTLTALWQWNFTAAPETARRWERCVAVTLAWLLASGPWGWGMAPVLLLFALVYLWPRPVRTLHRSTALWFGVALALALTGFALRPEAITALSGGLTAWIAEIGGSATSNPLGWPFLRLLIDQPLLAALGPLGLAVLWLAPTSTGRDGRRLALFLTGWLAWGLLLWLLPGRPPAALSLMGLPLAMAAATLIARVTARPVDDLTGLERFTLLTVQTALVVAGAFWLAALVENVAFNNQVWLTATVIVGLMAAVWVMFGVWAGWAATARVALVFYTLLLAALTVRSGWQLNHVAELMRPNGFWPAVTSPDTHLLVTDVERLSSLRRGDPNQIDMQIVYDISPDPVIGWHLREMRNLRHVRAVDATSFAAEGQALPLIVAPTLRNDALALPDAYIGSAYDTLIAWQPAMLPQRGANDESQSDAEQRWAEVWRPRLQWLLYRKINEPPVVQSVTLWAPR